MSRQRSKRGGQRSKRSNSVPTSQERAPPRAGVKDHRRPCSLHHTSQQGSGPPASGQHPAHPGSFGISQSFTSALGRQQDKSGKDRSDPALPVNIHACEGVNYRQRAMVQLPPEPPSRRLFIKSVSFTLVIYKNKVQTRT